MWWNNVGAYIAEYLGQAKKDQETWCEDYRLRELKKLFFFK